MIKKNGSRVKLRTSIYSTEDDSLELLDDMLGHKQVEYKMFKGQKKFNSVTQHYSKPWWATIYHLLKEYENVFYLEDCNTEWLKDWNREIPVLIKLVKEYGYSVKLEYQIEIGQETYPGIEFSSEFVTLLAQFNAEVAISLVNT